MKIDVSSLHVDKESSITGEKQLEYSGRTVVEDEIKLAGPVDFSYELTSPADRLIELDGNYRTLLRIPCSRCLASLKVVLQRKLRGLFLPDDYQGEEPELREGQYRLTYNKKEIDTWELLRQDFIVSLPMRPLCSEDCRGLCKICGQNLNEDLCGHDQEGSKVDPRLEKLKDIELD